ncbi:ribose transport system permease protein [Pseudobutyrivibrio sp. ACV-2]|uniref:ABC transporter permease n=1 Tax=Pseudobutyrivibrio sp. ACV-2 TaxID=1520801 RepID=UPI00089542B2|nr:ABC transporter permease [Pseudobutyrivibrio sp. ACV-2]SDZ89271.1 ribose transport system permease protein [Pseudobutyrivibrio sp. ACV-2]
MEEIKKNKVSEYLKTHINDVASYGGLIFCILVFTIIPPFFGENIWSQAKLANIISNVIVTALLSVGAVFVYSLGNMDISIGAQIRVYAMLIVLLGNVTGSLLPGILISAAIAIVIAIINGGAGQVLKVHPIIPSLVFMMILQGVSSIAYAKLGSRNITLRSVDFSAFKSTGLMVLVLVLETIVVSYLFYFTKFGKNARAIGANALAAEQCGINLLKFKVISYVIMGVMVVVAAIFQMGYTGSASDSTGTGFEMNVMIALILGGMPLSGGMRSKVSCAVVGSFTYSILAVGLPLIGVPTNMTFLIKSIIFIVVVLFTCRKKNGVLPR